MIHYFFLLQCLLYMNPTIGLLYDMTTESCFGFKSDCALKTGNRVCNNGIPTDAEVEAIKTFFSQTPFTWAINTADDATRAVLEKNNLKLKGSFPAMLLELNDVNQNLDENSFEIKQVNLNKISDIRLWAAIFVQLFQISESELLKMLQVLAQRIPHPLKLYIGYYDEKAVSACMLIIHGEIATLHWVGTVQEYRGKGFASALSRKALVDAKNVGCKQAVLMSTPLVKQIYERLGFKEYAQYAMYYGC
jgi:ribosomal protein S18 acetylase RimI-like enzyme